MEEPATLKDIAITFLRLAASGSVREAYSRFVGPGFRHHNPHFRGDAQSLMTAMEENAARHPDKMLEVRHALQENDLVAVHSRIRLSAAGPDIAAVHLFRFENERIVEMWDIGQAPPENSPNEHGMF